VLNRYWWLVSTWARVPSAFSSVTESPSAFATQTWRPSPATALGPLNLSLRADSTSIRVPVLAFSSVTELL
jgi:hypothetical protein